MKVVIVNDHVYADGGADVVALVGAEALSRQGVEVTFFSAQPLRDEAADARPYRVVSTGQFDLAHDPNPARVALQTLWNWRAAAALRNLLQGFDPADTVVHVHSWTKALSSSVFQAAAGAGFPVLCTLHDYFSVCPSGLLYDVKAKQLCPLRPMSAACIATHCDQRAYSHKLYRVARHAVQGRFGGLPTQVDTFLTISRFSERMVGQHLPVDTRYAFVRNPIDAVKPSSPADPAAHGGFLMVGRMFQPKGWEFFLRACELAQVPAVAVGDGEQRAELQQRFPSVRFLGPLDSAGVMQAMRSARALVLPSLWYETQGLVAAEAAAQGLPAIVAATTGAAEFLRDGETGLLFAHGSMDGLVQALRRMSEDDALVRRLGGAAFDDYWADPPTPAAHAAALLQVYEGVLRRRRAPAALQPASA